MKPDKHIPEKIITKSAVHKYTSYVRPEEAKKAREALQIKAARLKKIHQKIPNYFDKKGNKIFNRTSVCSQKKFIEHVNPTWKQVEKIHDKTGAIIYKHYVGNLSHCNNVYNCPTCANVILRRKEKKLNNIFEVLKVSHTIYMLTLTIYHNKSMSALEIIDKLNESWRYLIRHSAVKFREKFKYWVRAFEVTYSNEKGFHPHFHVVFAKPNNMKNKEFMKIIKPLLIEWKQITNNNSDKYHGYCLTKYEKENYIFEVNKGITAKELTNIMPSEKTYSGDAMYLALHDLNRWHQYATAVRGKKRVQCSDSFNKLSKILNQQQKEDSEEMKDNDDSKDIFEFVNSWNKVNKNPVLIAKMKIALDNTNLPLFEELLKEVDLKISENKYSIIGINNTYTL